MQDENKKNGKVDLGVNISKELYMRLKIRSTKSGITMSDIVESWIRKYTPEL